MSLIDTNKVKIHLLKQTNSQAAYNALASANQLESNTLYVLANGRGYLGDKLLFTGDDITANLVQQITEDNKTVTDKSASVKAMTDYIASILDTTNLVKTKFFRGVKRYVLVESDFTTEGTYGKLADLYNADTCPNGCNVGDVGLLFTADNDADDDGNGTDLDKEMYYWICLNDLINIYTAGNTNSIHMSVDGAGQFTANLNVNSAEDSIIVNENGISLNKATTISLTSASDSKLATEKSVLDFVVKSLNDALADLVKYQIDTEVSSDDSTDGEG